MDARKLAELLHNNQLRSVYHGDHGLRTLKELVRSYLTITQDLSRVMTRVKAIYRSWAIPCTGKQVYAPRHRAEWLGKISEPGVLRRAEFYYQQLDALRCLRQEVRRDLLVPWMCGGGSTRPRSMIMSNLIEVIGNPAKTEFKHVPAANYMAYWGNQLRFGKLTMADADMILIDMNPEDPFDFDLDYYKDQLVPGYSKITASFGLRVFMKDLDKVQRAALTKTETKK